MRKKCTKCLKQLPLEDFGKNKNAKDGLNHRCKLCNTEASKKYIQRKKAELGEEEVARQRKEKYSKNKDAIEARRKKSMDLRRDHYNEVSRNWKRRNPDKVKASNKKSRSIPENRAKAIARSKNYHQTHRKETNEQLQKRMAVDPAFKLERKLRSRFADTLRKELNRNPSAKRRKKQASVMKLLDCTPPELVDHLEKQFTEGMSWDNWGKGKDCWNIDHIKPLASFDMLDEDDLKECWHYTNLQPLWEMENLQKHDSLDWDQTNLQ